MNLYQHVKTRLFHYFDLGLYLIWKFCNLGQEHFGTYLRNHNFPKHGILCRNIANNITFIIDQIQEKLITKFFNKFRKVCFWPIFTLLRQNIFPKKFQFCHAHRQMLLTPGIVWEKTNEPILRKLPERWKKQKIKIRNWAWGWAALLKLRVY